MAAGKNLAGSGQNLDGSLNTIITAFKLLRDSDGKMRRLATNYRLEPGTGTGKVVLNYGRVTAYRQKAGVDTAQAQALSDELTTFTPYEVAVQVLLPGSTLRQVADRGLYSRAGQMMENAYALKEDQDGCAQLDSFSTTKGGAGTVLSPGLHMAAVTSLRMGNSNATPEPPPEDSLFGLYHPCSLHAVKGRLAPLTDFPLGSQPYDGSNGVTMAPGTNELTGEILKKWRVKELGGTPIVEQPNISVDTGDDAKNGVFSREGLIYIGEVEPKMEVDETGASRGAKLCTYWGAYGWGVYRAAAYGVEVTADASIPTA